MINIGYDYYDGSNKTCISIKEEINSNVREEDQRVEIYVSSVDSDKDIRISMTRQNFMLLTHKLFTRLRKE